MMVSQLCMLDYFISVCDWRCGGPPPPPPKKNTKTTTTTTNKQTNKTSITKLVGAKGKKDRKCMMVAYLLQPTSQVRAKRTPFKKVT